MVSHGDNAGRARLNHAERDADTQAHFFEPMHELRRAVDFADLRLIAGEEKF